MIGLIPIDRRLLIYFTQ